MVNCSFTNGPYQHTNRKEGGGTDFHLFQCISTGQPTLFEGTPLPLDTSGC